jgi:hypothetical protein
MNQALIESIANAVLYEGYNLYPYRPSSVKNQQRWTFGGVYPQAYCAAQSGSEQWTMQTECLVLGAPETALSVKCRFLHLQTRRLAELPRDGEALHFVEALRTSDAVYQSWEEAVQREVAATDLPLGPVCSQFWRLPFAFPGSCETEPVRGPDGKALGVTVREQQELDGSLEIEAEPVPDSLLRPSPAAERQGNEAVQRGAWTPYKLRIRVRNLTRFDAGDAPNRPEALMRSFISTHLILGLQAGAFVSLLDPPESLREAAASCHNAGCWPVLAGEAGEQDAMLASPIILYDYPQIAPESPGDLFDATEIDEILTLRILTLTEEEKKELRGADDRTRALLDRTEMLPQEQLAKMHGALRGLRALPSESLAPWGEQL